MPLSTFAMNLRVARNMMEWSQRQAAEAVGVKLNTYQAYEESRAEPCHAILIKIAVAYGIHDLAGFISDPKYYSKEGVSELNLMVKHYQVLRPEAKRAVLGLLQSF